MSVNEEKQHACQDQQETSRRQPGIPGTVIILRDIFQILLIIPLFRALPVGAVPGICRQLTGNTDQTDDARTDEHSPRQILQKGRINGGVRKAEGHPHSRCGKRIRRQNVLYEFPEHGFILTYVP